MLENYENETGERNHYRFAFSFHMCSLFMVVFNLENTQAMLALFLS